MRAAGRREDRLHGQVRIRRHDAQRRELAWRRRGHIDLVHRVDDAARVFESAKQRMRCVGCGIFFQAQVRIEHVFLELARIGRAEKRGEAEVLAPHAPLVVERCLVGGDQAAAALDKCAQAGALLVGQRGDVGQDQRAERRKMLGVEAAVVHHLKRNARFNQRLVEAQRGLLDLFARLFSAVEQRALLRVDQAHARQRAHVLRRYFSLA